jgi:hypothetical protein
MLLSIGVPTDQSSSGLGLILATVGLAGGGVIVDCGALPVSGALGAGVAFLARPRGRAAAAISGSAAPKFEGSMSADRLSDSPAGTGLTGRGDGRPAGEFPGVGLTVDGPTGDGVVVGGFADDALVAGGLAGEGLAAGELAGEGFA